MPLTLLLLLRKLRWGSPARSVSLAYKDVFETEKNEAERRELHDELVKARSELAARAGREKQLAAEVQESQILRKALQLEVKDSTTKINELQARLERAKSELNHSQELLEKQKDELTKKSKELTHKDKSLEEEKEVLQDEA
ncbi:hypothetical protein ACOSQ3_013531 [Xanthoceras sorbifolium]